MRTIWASTAIEDYQHWTAEDPKIVARIHALVASIKATPFSGLGKPEPLKGPLSGAWSRRITAEHRLVHRLRGAGEAQALEILQCRLHY